MYNNSGGEAQEGSHESHLKISVRMIKTLRLQRGTVYDGNPRATLHVLRSLLNGSGLEHILQRRQDTKRKSGNRQDHVSVN